MAVYGPATAPEGIAMTIVGFHDVEFATSDTPTAEKAVRFVERLWASREVSWPGVRTAVPLDDVAGPDQ